MVETGKGTTPEEVEKMTTLPPRPVAEITAEVGVLEAQLAQIPVIPDSEAKKVALHALLEELMETDEGKEAIKKLNAKSLDEGLQELTPLAHTREQTPVSEQEAERNPKDIMERLEYLAYRDESLKAALQGWKNISSQDPHERVRGDVEALVNFHGLINERLRVLKEAGVAFEELPQ